MQIKPTDINGTIPVAQGGTGATDAAGARTNLGFSDIPVWTSYTPTCTPTSGSITAYTATGKCAIIGDLCFLILTVDVTNVGTAAAAVFDITLPFTASTLDGANYSFIGRTNLGNKSLNAFVRGDSLGIARCSLYDGSAPLPSPGNLRLTGFYRLQSGGNILVAHS